MRLNEVVAWYQKKIGTYDKQQWEKTVEQRILHGFTNVPLKTTKLKTELIDVDLVRGSTFPKAKPKQSLVTVLRLAVLRLIFLPLYAKWWVEQTSPKVFSFLLFVYLVQMFNWGVYCFNVNRLGPDAEHIVSISELLIPLALSTVLSIIHSQIVATASNLSKTEKRRQLHLQPRKKKRERVRRKKKNVRLRTAPTDGSKTTVATFIEVQQLDKLATQPISSTPISHNSISNSNNHTTNVRHLYQQNIMSSTSTPIESKALEYKNNVCDNVVNASPTSASAATPRQLQTNDLTVPLPPSDLTNLVSTIPSDIKSETRICSSNIEILEPSTSLRKRNVNWDSPIKSQFVVSAFEYYDNPQESEAQDVHDELVGRTEAVYQQNATNNEEHCDTDNGEAKAGDAGVQNVSEQTGDDDGFESLNGKSSSGEENLNLNDKNCELNLENINALPSIKSQYRNTWIKENLENNKTISCKGSDSDTDTLKGNTTCLQPAKGTLLSTLSNIKPQNTFKNVQTHLSSESEHGFTRKLKNPLALKPQPLFLHKISKEDSSDTDEENEDCETVSTPGTGGSNPQFTEGTTSATEWIGVTTNSDECSYTSDLNHSDSQMEFSENGGVEYDFTPTYILSPTCGAGDRISCTIWERRDTKKAELSVLDISSAIIEKVEGMPETCDYIYIGVFFSMMLSFTPAFCRLCEATYDSSNSTELKFFEMPVILWEKASFSCMQIFEFAFGDSEWERWVLTTSLLLRLSLTFLFFFLLAVAERTFKQRFLYAKLFSHLTSSRRARKSDLPHFRLNKVRNIKTWLSVRSYLKKRGPQRSVDVIVSAAFILTLLLLAFLSVEWLKDTVRLHSLFNLEALAWSCALGVFLLRFMTLGTKINRKYRSISVLITEQINLYLQIEQKPQKKEELMVANSVLKLAADLLKELESPFKISGLSANPVLYTTVKVVILSALSGVLSEILGFKLKLHKIKIK